MSKVPKPPVLSIKQEIAIRNARKQYNVWRSQAHPEWAREWLCYHDEIVSSKNWENVTVPVNDRNECFFKTDKDGKPAPYKRPGMYQSARYSGGYEDEETMNRKLLSSKVYVPSA